MLFNTLKVLGLCRISGRTALGEAVEHFSYDGVGNRTQDAKTGTNQWSYNQNNELQSFDTTSFKYNLNGQMTEKTVNGEKTTYSYNLDGRLKEIKDNSNQTIATYQYDPFGLRLSKKITATGKTTYYHYSEEGLVGEYDQAGQLIQSYGYKPDSWYTTDPVFTHRPDFISKAKGGYVYYINDHLFTPQKLITETGRKVWEAHADAFGKTAITNNEFNNPLRFPGQYKDKESHLRYNFQRYYDVQLGRYITADPIGLDGGINEFGYVYGDPVSYFDPTGEIAPIFIAGGAAYARCVAMCEAIKLAQGFLFPGSCVGAGDNCWLTCSNPLNWFKLKKLGKLLGVKGQKALPAPKPQKALPPPAPKIKGYTKHGLNQAIGRNGGRGVKAKNMSSAVRNPKKVIKGSNGATVYRGKRATVVLNSKGKVVTTYGKSRGPQIRPQGTTRSSGSGSAQRKANSKGFSYNPNAIR